MDVKLRAATEDDLELLLAWRSIPRVYAGFYQQDQPINWETHREWWESRENRRDWIVVADTDEQRDVGCVNVSGLDTKEPEVGVYIGEVTLWGEGAGRQAVTLALHWLRGEGYNCAVARILNENHSSRALFEAIGFERVGQAREGESKYLIEL